MKDIILTGLDGSNPLGFLAALGVLRATTDARCEGVRLLWREDGVWRPVLTGFDGTFEALLDLLDADRVARRSDPALALAYEAFEHEGKVSSVGAKVKKLERDLKPSPAVMRAYLESLASGADPASRWSVDWGAAFGSDVVTDNKGNTKPTALHFTAGQQRFLLMVEELLEGVTRDDLAEALLGPWRYTRNLPVMGWDCTANRDYALRACDPSGDAKTGVPGADWLGVRGLGFFGVAPRGSRLLTTGVTGKWKSERLRWPTWTVPLSADVVGSLIRADIATMSGEERFVRGVGALFECTIRRSDQGGYGSVTPSRPVLA